MRIVNVFENHPHILLEMMNSMVYNLNEIWTKYE